MIESAQAFWLALVQGLTEFLPVSSSAHLVLLPILADWRTRGSPLTLPSMWGLSLRSSFICGVTLSTSLTVGCVSGALKEDQKRVTWDGS